MHTVQLHTLEDFTAHSNFCELALVSMGHSNIFVHVGDNVRIQSPNGRWVAPLVTGTFGSSDFLHSLLGGKLEVYNTMLSLSHIRYRSQRSPCKTSYLIQNAFQKTALTNPTERGVGFRSQQGNGFRAVALGVRGVVIYRHSSGSAIQIARGDGNGNDS